MRHPITVGLDGTPESLAAADWGARTARRRGFPLRLVQAWQQGPDTPPDTADPGREHRMMSVLPEAAAVLGARYPGLPITTERVLDDAVVTLLDQGERSEMLVLGSRGHGAVVGFLLGSVSLKVIARAKAPVVLVRAGGHSAGERTGEEIVVGIQDVGEASGTLAGFAFAEAAARGATVRAVRAWSLPPFYALSPASLQWFDENGGVEALERKTLSDALVPWREEFPDVPVIEDVEIGNASEVLLSASSRAGLVVVGRRINRRALGMRVGAVAYAALHHANCPVAVVPHG